MGAKMPYSACFHHPGCEIALVKLVTAESRHGPGEISRIAILLTLLIQDNDVATCQVDGVSSAQARHYARTNG